MSLANSLNEFRASIVEANSFIGLAFQQDVGGIYLLPRNQRQFITDSSFLKIFIAWESFLESSFTKYMIGENSILGNTITRYVQPQDIKHAGKLLIGTQKYVDWSNPETVRRLCNLCFDVGNPLDTFIGSLQSDLFDLKTIRNAAAHLTSTTGSQLDALATRRLRRPCTNVSVSDFIFSPDPESILNETILTGYLSLLDVAAEGIANG